MFRREPKAVEQWSISNVEMCAERQKEILNDIWPALRPGGLLVYSTCTFNSEENEQNVRWMVEELDAEPLALEISADRNITGALLSESQPVYRFIPGMTDGEGFFLAVLRKKGDSSLLQPRQPRLQPLQEKHKKEVMQWVENPENFNFVMDKDVALALPKQHTAAMLALQQKLRVLHSGIPLAELKNNKLLPLHSLAMSTELCRSSFAVVELEREQALAYLHREAISLLGAPLGYLLLTYGDVPLGFVKNIGNRANNMYPAEWRIRKNPMEF
jgi:NOL1/NOP2/fmu family ribosome biogenesis protein